MSGPVAVRTGFGSRVALRTFTIFGVAAVLPVALFAVIGYLFVSEELQLSAQQRLQEASKRYGIALNDRLIQAELSMLEAARLELQSGTADTDGSRLHRYQLLDELPGDEVELNWRPVAPQEMRLPEGWQAWRALQARMSGAVPQIRLIVTVDDGTRKVRLIADPADRNFWLPEGGLANTRHCVSINGQQLHCETDDFDAVQGEPLQSGEWSLFLKPRLGSASWDVSVEQPRRVALAALRSFRYTLPVVALLAIAGALLLGATHIRRLHRPLALLTAAAAQMSRGRFRKPVEIVSDDEFAHVGRAFNRLASRLRRQFGLLATLGEIDRLILEHPTFEPVVTTLLPRMPRVLGCRAAAVLLAGEPGTPPHLQFHLGGADAAITTAPSDIALQVQQQLEANANLAHGGTVPLAALVETCGGVGAWLPSPIVVAGVHRGMLLAGFRDGDRTRSRIGHQFRGLAHRLAVALGNEDRERALVKHAYFDPLTALPNRQLFRDRIEQELVRGRRDVQPVALLHVDLDKFSNFNESLGHEAGDELLKGVALRLQEGLQEGHTLARLDGDEFALLCPGADSQHAGTLAAKLLAQLTRPFAIGTASYVIQASIGIAVFPGSDSGADGLLRSANAAMYRAKQSGRARSAFFEEGMNLRAERRLQIEQRLRLALDAQELTLAYQPKLRTSDRSAGGFEALARWHDALLGNVSPAEFIPVAEESGLIGRLGSFALRETCRQLSAWGEQGLPVTHVAVNVSVYQLRDPGFAAALRETLAAAGLVPSQLQLEITESMLASNDAAVIRQLEDIRATGVQIAMDDFGTGYSSLASLRELPVDVLKIDRSFVVRGCDTDSDAALLRGVVELAHTLGKTVVAEGVETQAQFALLRDFGCDTVQGYLFSKPLAAADVPQFIAAAQVERHELQATG